VHYLAAQQAVLALDLLLQALEPQQLEPLEHLLLVV
jgi:hypothetical protein